MRMITTLYIGFKKKNKFNVRRVAASIDKSSLGRGWHDYFSTGDYSELHGVQRNRLDNLSSQLGGEFSVEDLAIINKYYDFQLPQGVGDNAFTGIGIREWNPGSIASMNELNAINKFKDSVEKFNIANESIVARISNAQADSLKGIAQDVTKNLIDEGVPKQLWKDVYDKLNIPQNLRGIEILGK
ncbi:hypothetical protein HCA69_09680 [Listeria grandensis]|uniref:Uncharacterized protein n=1 Tax=Listeria grandensis TaxID=1494963 RepID=A0A7X0Y460_9LIST|nr:hypothetical protein [Listeria grandensis]MBC1936636.1 hypothetical protein [Listeria grandensis]